MGVGSFGAVVRACKGNKTFALKALMDTDDLASRFELESNILASLQHPKIPQFVERFTQEDVHYLVQEFISGYPLSYHIINGRCFSEIEVLHILIQLLTLLVYLHSPTPDRLPVIHRDLRLSNLFWTNGRLYLVDFGLAGYFKGEESPGCQDQPPGHSPLFHRPGGNTYTRLRKEISPRSDLFGAGVVALDLFTNWIEDDNLFRLPWQEILPTSQELKTFLQHLLIPELQYDSASQALSGLQSLLPHPQ